MQPVIELTDVCKRYGTQQTLDRVSLSVPPGVVFALLGENGAGKTTLIRTLLGLVEPQAGAARVLGFDSQLNGREIRRQVGYVSERPALDDWMSVDEVGWYAAGFYPDGFQPRYRQLVQSFQVPEARRIKQLSKGMRSKVALSLALAHDPQLLILDEPTSGLDTLVRREFLESMVDFTAGGKTVLLSSHQIHEVERVADMVAILHRGQLLTCESLDTLKQQVSEATVVLRNEQSLELPPEVLCCDRRGRQAQLYVRASEEAAAEILRALVQVERFELRRPSLEEIFVAYLKSDGAPASRADRQASVQPEVTR